MPEVFASGALHPELPALSHRSLGAVVLRRMDARAHHSDLKMVPAGHCERGLLREGREGEAGGASASQTMRSTCPQTVKRGSEAEAVEGKRIWGTNETTGPGVGLRSTRKGCGGGTPPLGGRVHSRLTPGCGSHTGHARLP